MAAKEVELRLGKLRVLFETDTENNIIAETVEGLTWLRVTQPVIGQFTPNSNDFHRVFLSRRGPHHGNL